MISSFLKGLQQETEAKSELSRNLRDAVDLQRWVVGRAVHVSRTSWVVEVTLDGQPCIAKQYLQGDVAGKVTRAQAELAYLEPRTIQGTYEVNRCVLAVPEAGILILSRCEGERLDSKIVGSHGEERQRIFELSGGFLNWYAGHRQRVTTFGPRYWIKQMQNNQAKCPLDPADATRLDHLLEACIEQVAQLRGTSIRQAASHGNFVGPNAFVTEGGICGVGVQGETWLAVAREAARFLVWQMAHEPAFFGKTTLGIRSEDWSAFLSSGLVAEDEQLTTLPFFVGEQLHSKFLGFQGRPRRLATLRHAIDEYCGACVHH